VSVEAIRAILDEEFASTGYPESAVERLLALVGDRYEWGTRKTWSADMGGHTEDEIRSSERDARDRVVDWKWRQNRPHASARIVSFALIRRTVGPWEVVES
jgi:hypothetical protein